MFPTSKKNVHIGRVTICYRGWTTRPFVRRKPVNIGTTRLYTWGPIAWFLEPAGESK